VRDPRSEPGDPVATRLSHLRGCSPAQALHGRPGRRARAVKFRVLHEGEGESTELVMVGDSDGLERGLSESLSGLPIAARSVSAKDSGVVGVKERDPGHMSASLHRPSRARPSQHVGFA